MLRLKEVSYYIKISYFVEGFTALYWDLGGREILRSIWNKYYPECHGIIYFIDGSDQEKLDESLNTLSKIAKSISE